MVMNIKILVTTLVLVLAILLSNTVYTYEVTETKHFKIIIYSKNIPEELKKHVINELERAYDTYVNELNLKIAPPCSGNKYTIYCPCPSEVGSRIYLKIKNSHACVSKIVFPLCPVSTKEALTKGIFHELTHAVQYAYNPHDYERYEAVYENIANGFAYTYGFDKLFAFLSTFECTFKKYTYRASAYDCGGFFTWLILVKDMTPQEILEESIVKKNFKYLDKLYDEYVDWVKSMEDVVLYVTLKLINYSSKYELKVVNNEVYIYEIMRIKDPYDAKEKIYYKLLRKGKIPLTTYMHITYDLLLEKEKSFIRILLTKLPINELSLGVNRVNVSLLNGVLNFTLTLIVSKNYTLTMISNDSLMLYEKLYVNNTLVSGREFARIIFQPFTVVVNVNNDSKVFPVKFNAINELKISAGNESLTIKFNITNPKLLVNVDNNYSLTFKLGYNVDFIKPVKTNYEVKNEVFKINIFGAINNIIDTIL